MYTLAVPFVQTAKEGGGLKRFAGRGNGAGKHRRSTTVWGALAFAVISLSPGSLPAIPDKTVDHRSNDAPRHLVLCLDGVSYATVEKMMGEGSFRRFQKLARLIAPFPTLTNPGFIEILQPLGAPPSQGYEDYSYDPSSRKMRGGFLARFRRRTFIEGTFRELFDDHPSGLAMTLEYALPPLSPWIEARLSLARAINKFRASDEPIFIAYISSTDPLAHVGGETLVRNFLAHLDRVLEKLIAESGGRIQVTIVSDHGNHFTKYRRVDLSAALRADGFRMERRVTTDRSVVHPRYGLVSCAVLYTAEANEPRVAEVVAHVPGVDFAAYKRGEAIYVVSRRGRARIQRRGDRYRYLVFQGDPLDLQPIRDELCAQGRCDADGFIADADLFAATHSHVYPDPLRRLWEGLTDYVRHPANVIVSLQDGHYEGNDLLDLLAVLRATHGNIRRSQTDGILLTTMGDLPDVLRARDAGQFLFAGTTSRTGDRASPSGTASDGRQR